MTIIKIRCDWGTVYTQAGSGTLCISPHDLSGGTGRYVYPDDFFEEGADIWALKSDRSKKIKIEQ